MTIDAFMNYLGIGSGLCCLAVIAVMIVSKMRKTHPLAIWTAVSERLKKTAGAIAMCVIVLVIFLLGLCIMAGIGWAFTQLLKLLGLLP